MRDERRESDLKELSVHFEANLSTRAWHVFQIFAKTVQNIKNRSIKIVFQYKFTIKPVIFQPLNSQKYKKFGRKSVA